MAKATPHTAFLIFLRSESDEARAKELGRVGKRRPLFRAMNERVIRLARRTGCPVVVVKGPQQAGESFGERFTHAFESVFSQGYERVIALGNDCLNLSFTDLRQALEALDARPAVLGPALDGGAYLVGLRKEVFCPSSFQALPWQQPCLWEALSAYCGSYHTLRPERDADDVHSLRQALQHCRDIRFRHVILQLLETRAPVPSCAPAGARPISWSLSLFFRGPPL